MTYFSPLRRLSATVEFIHHPNLHLFLYHRKSLENLSQNSCALKFTQVHILAFPNFLQFFGNFWDFPNYFCHPNFHIHFPISRNQFLMDFLFLFFSSTTSPLTPSTLACRPAQAAPSPPSHHPGPPGFIARSAQAAHLATRAFFLLRMKAMRPPPPLLATTAPPCATS
jgi:hypothetical protein